MSKYFVNKFNLSTKKQVRSITSKSIEKLKQHDWPGNIRELRNIIETALVKVNGTLLKEEIFDLPSPGDKKCLQEQVLEQASVQKEKSIERKYDPYCYEDPVRCFVRRVISGEKNWKDLEGSSFPEKERVIALAIEVGFKREIMAKIMGITKNNLNQKLFRLDIHMREIKLRYKVTAQYPLSR